MQSGITLVALVVTIVVLLILAGVSISLVLGNNGIITKTQTAKNKQQIATMSEELELYIENKIIETSGNYDSTKLNATTSSLTYDGVTQTGETIKNILTTETDDVLTKYHISTGELSYIGSDSKESDLFYETYGKSAQYILPKEYQRVEYLEGTGTQYIDTGYRLTSNKVKYDITYKFMNIVSGQSVYGAEDRINNPRYSGVFYIPTSGILNLFIGNSQNALSINVNTDTVYNMIMDIQSENNGVVIYNDTSYNFSYVGGLSKSLTIYLFGNHRSDEIYQKSQIRCYKFKIYDNNILVRNMIPCYRKSDNVAGMYDKVNDVFYTNAGIGTFNVGSDLG